MLHVTWVSKGITTSAEWHTGEKLPRIDGRVVTFQADGEELEVLLEVLRKYARKETNVLSNT